MTITSGYDWKRELNPAVAHRPKAPEVIKSSPVKVKTMWAAIRDAKFLKVSNGSPTDSLWVLTDLWDKQADAIDGNGTPLVRQQFDIQLDFASYVPMRVDKNQDGKIDALDPLVRLDGIEVAPDKVTEADKAVGFKFVASPFTTSQIKERIVSAVNRYANRFTASKVTVSEIDKIDAAKIAAIKQAVRDNLVAEKDAVIANKKPGDVAAAQAKIDAWDALSDSDKTAAVTGPMLSAKARAQVEQISSPKEVEQIFTVDKDDTRQGLPTVLSALGPLPLIWEVPA